MFFRHRTMWGEHPFLGRESHFQKGDLKYVILDLLKDKPRYGYEVIRELEERSHGFYSPSAGVVYPTLQMLEEMGYASAAEQDGKKVYSITDEGRQFLTERKDFTEEIGEDEAAEYNALFSTAAKLVTSKVLRGSVPKDLKYETAGATTTAWALMVQDPKVIADAFADQKNTAKALYTRFRASQAFSELDEEVKKYEDFKKQDAAGMLGE